MRCHQGVCESSQQRIVRSHYWTFEPKNPIRYRTDAQYEETIDTLLRQACVEDCARTYRAADLSGGYDSRRRVYRRRHLRE